MKKTIAELSLFAALLGSDISMPLRSKITHGKTTPKPPGNSKEYFFDEYGYFVSTKENSAYSCYAINDKNAIRKFNKWKKSKP